MKFIYSAVFIAAIAVFGIFPTFAQENEAVVIDEVVAQVNDGVITLSRVKREMKDAVDGLVQEQRKTPEVAKAEVEAKQGELIANLINEELLLQRGKEEGVENDVEAQINQRFVQLMKQYNLKTLDDLYALMKSQGVDPEAFRDNMRKQFSREMVINRSVDQKLYWSFSGKQLRDFYQKNPEKFTTPEEVTLSAIFLNYAGRDEAAVKDKAKQLVAQIRKGADFQKLAIENSDDPTVKDSKGVQGKFKLPDLNDAITAAIKNVKAGGVTEPLEIEGGIQIVRVDERVVASSASVFDEDAVRRALTFEKLPEARRKFIADLRKDAFIKVSESYRPIVMPHLLKEAAPEAKKPATN